MAPEDFIARQLTDHPPAIRSARRLIEDERRRQYALLGRSTIRDLTVNANGELAQAAHAMISRSASSPWPPNWNPLPRKGRLRDLVRGGALLMAERDRLHAEMQAKEMHTHFEANPDHAWCPTNADDAAFWAQPDVSAVVAEIVAILRSESVPDDLNP